MDNRTLEVLSGFLDGVYGGLEIACVIEGVENTKDIYSLISGLPDKGPYNLIAVMPISYYVLTPQQHLQRCIACVVLDGAQALPRVFIQEPQATVEGCATPAFY